MALSSISNTDILMSNRITNYTQGRASEFLSYNKSNNVGLKKHKMTPKQCKPSYRSYGNEQIDSKMKKSSSLHNIEKLNDDQQFISIPNINTKNTSFDKKQINLNSELLSRIEREKKQYEAKISELIQNLETRKKEKEILIYEKKNFIETVKLMQKQLKQLTNENTFLRHKLKEYGIEIDYESEKIEDKSDQLNASADAAALLLLDAYSVTFATIGDSSSMCDQLSDDSPGNPSIGEEFMSASFYANTNTTDREILDSLSVSTLQDRIQKMEEDSYCTNEELQATMQELVALQKNLDSLNDENRCLGDDRAILLESLCEQTQKLQKCRLQIDNLKFLLLNTGSKDGGGSMLDLLQELYGISEEENRALVVQNEECKQTIMSCQNEYTELSGTIEYLREELDRQVCNYNSLQERQKEEMWQREQVEALLKNHNELFRDCLGWADCSSGVLALIQQDKSFRQTELLLRVELREKGELVELLSGQLRQLEEGMRELKLHHRRDDNRQVNIDKLQAKLADSEKEVRLLTQNLDVMAQKYAEDMIGWRDYERDLLVAVAAANGMKEEKERDLAEVEGRLEASEHLRRHLQEKVDSGGGSGGSGSGSGVGVGGVGAGGAVQILKHHHHHHERATLPSLVMSKSPASAVSNTNNSVKTLIQSIEDQVKAVNITPKEPAIIPNKASNNNTVPRSSTLSKPEKNEITRTATIPSRLKEESPVVRRNSELSQPKSLSESITTKPKVNPISAESSIIIPSPPLITVVSQASTILQSVSRRTSVTSSIPPDHHSLYPNSSQKPPSPPPSSAECLSQLVKITNKGSKRNALLYWCQTTTASYQKIDITNFSSSWNDGLALCALFHAYDNDLLDFKKLADATSSNPDRCQKRLNFRTASEAAQKIGISDQLNIETMLVERPDWNDVMNYVTEIYQHFERKK